MKNFITSSATLNTLNLWSHVDFYVDDITESMLERLDESLSSLGVKQKQWNFKLAWDLSYRQGDGVMLESGEIGQDAVEKIVRRKLPEIYSAGPRRTSHWYSHENCFEFAVIFNDPEEAEESNITEDEVAEKLTEYFRNLCRTELKPFGYEMIEEIEDKEIISAAFNDWKEINEVESPDRLWEFKHSTQEDNATPDMVHVWDGGDSTIGGLWVRLPEVIEHTREVTYYTFAE